MLKFHILVFFTWSFFLTHAQSNSSAYVHTEQDSLKKTLFLKQLGNGYLPTKYFNFDLRYLVKYNQFEALRTGLGGVTNGAFSKKFKLNAYGVYGFRDDRFKYSFGGGYKIANNTNTWINFSYTDDLQETGSSIFLTDKRFFQFFEPRLLNIELFYKHITKAISIEHQLHPKIATETKFSLNKISPTFDYQYLVDGNTFNSFKLSTAKVALQWSPFNLFETTEKNSTKTIEKYPKFTLQYTKSFKDILNSDFDFSKLDFKAIHKIKFKNEHISELVLVSGITNGNTPLTHVYHAYPNNINKETIMQRFSVAGITSFETMFFNEFFSDKFATFQFKHFLKPFRITSRYKPQLVFISRFAIGDFSNPEQHQNISFGSLKKGYTESGFELNKLFFGFGLSFTYRYGAYHLPETGDNVALKFTFNVTL